MEFCKIPDKCPATKDCVKLNYRGSECSALRAQHNADYDPDDDFKKETILILYYRDSEGKIINATDKTGGKSRAELEKLCEEFNNGTSSGTKSSKTAYVEEVPIDSLTAYLFQRDKNALQSQRDMLRRAAEALDDARDAIVALGV